MLPHRRIIVLTLLLFFACALGGQQAAAAPAGQDAELRAACDKGGAQAKGNRKGQ